MFRWILSLCGAKLVGERSMWFERERPFLYNQSIPEVYNIEVSVKELVCLAWHPLFF